MSGLGSADIDLNEVRASIRALCSDFPGTYWQELDASGAYPTAFVKALTEGGWLSILIPGTYGGAGLGIRAASVVLEEINRSGANSSACHAQIYLMGMILRHGSDALKDAYLPGIAAGELRLQAFGVTEPTAGSDATRITTRAERRGDQYVISGQKIWTSRAEHSDLLLLLARTTPYDLVENKTDGLSVFIVEMREAVASGALTIRPIRTMFQHATTELFITDLTVPAANLIGEEGKGFRYIIDGWNAERILIASECIGDARWFVEHATAYASQRIVFGRPIGQNQGVQFPIARAHMAAEAADLVRWRASDLFDAGLKCGAEANIAKYLAAEASWQAANATHSADLALRPNTTSSASFGRPACIRWRPSARTSFWDSSAITSLVSRSRIDRVKPATAVQ